MGEYEYYEFQAVDRQLSTDEMRALRAISSRATITRTRFSNFYTFGSLKANPHDPLARYFDVFVHLAHWRHRELAFRLPKGVLGAKTAKLYAAPNGVMVRMQGSSTLVIVSAESPDDAIESGQPGQALSVFSSCSACEVATCATPPKCPSSGLPVLVAYDGQAEVRSGAGCASTRCVRQPPPPGHSRTRARPGDRYLARGRLRSHGPTQVGPAAWGRVRRCG